MSYTRSDDINLLVPSLRSVVQALLDAMLGLGYLPTLHDTLRTPTEAYTNASNGSGIKDSLHCYGVAADIICAKHGWSCEKAGCHFFRDLPLQAERLGLVSGVHFPKVDADHVQGVPVSKQNAIRAAKTEAERDVIVAKFLNRLR